MAEDENRCMKEIKSATSQRAGRRVKSRKSAKLSHNEIEAFKILAMYVSLL